LVALDSSIVEMMQKVLTDCHQSLPDKIQEIDDEQNKSGIT